MNRNDVNENGVNENGVNENGVNENGVNENGVNENGVNDENVLLDVLAFVEGFAASLPGSSIRVSYKAISKRARDFSSEVDLQFDERDALYNALIAIVDATIKAKRRGKRTARLATEAFAKRVRLIVVAAIFVVLTIAALWFGAYETAQASFLCFALLVAPELADFILALFRK